jgi:hypothetical protein
MSFITTSLTTEFSVLYLNSEIDEIDTSPTYQRSGEIWTKEKKQLLIDSIINRYDLPKIYFHKLKNGKYAVVDGKQRLEAIIGFLNGDFPLSDDFVFLRNTNVEAAGLTYQQIAELSPKLKINFDSFVLPVVIIDTDDIDLIEDMFSRLNEAVPLNAPEKRNAMGGPMAETVRSLANTQFFTKKVKVPKTRFRHLEMACKLLLLSKYEDIQDLKKAYLDEFVKSYKIGNKDTKKKNAKDLLSYVKSVLKEMNKIFKERDELLVRSSTIPIYFLLFEHAIYTENLTMITRTKLLRFNRDRKENRLLAADDIINADYDLLEFDRLSVQGTNDPGSIKERLNILTNYLENY